VRIKPGRRTGRCAHCARERYHARPYVNVPTSWPPQIRSGRCQ